MPVLDYENGMDLARLQITLMRLEALDRNSSVFRQRATTYLIAHMKLVNALSPEVASNYFKQVEFTDLSTLSISIQLIRTRLLNFLPLSQENGYTYRTLRALDVLESIEWYIAIHKRRHLNSNRILCSGVTQEE